jgi:hypothetical protein
MDHPYIDEQQVAERFLMGRLTPEEADLFAAHSLACAECLERLELAESLQRGLRHFAVREAEQRVELARAGVLAALVRFSRSRQAGWLAALGLLCAVLLPGGLLLRRVGELDRELGQARAERDSAAPAQRELQTARAQLARERQAAERERRQRETLDAERARLSQPQVNTPILTLSPQRTLKAAPAAEITQPRESGWILLSLDLEGPAGARYRATLLGPDGASRWQGSGLEGDAQGSLALLLPSSLLAPGDSVLRIDSLSPGAAPAPTARFVLRVKPRP